MFDVSVLGFYTVLFHVYFAISFELTTSRLIGYHAVNALNTRL